MSKSTKSTTSVEPEVAEDATPTDQLVVEDTPPTEATPVDPTPVPEQDEPVVEETPAEDPEPETPVEEPVVEPSPEPETPERDVPEGDKPVSSIPVGSVVERAVTLASKIEDDAVRELVIHALADQRVFTKDADLRHRTQVSHCIREMNRWIRTNIPSSASYKTFMEGINSYLLQVETHGIPSMWSAEASSAPLDEIQARKAAMAIERAVAHAELLNDGDMADNEEYQAAKAKLVATLNRYAQDTREGKIK